jgi:hypothetical protein
MIEGRITGRKIRGMKESRRENDRKIIENDRKRRMTEGRRRNDKKKMEE